MGFTVQGWKQYSVFISFVSDWTTLTQERRNELAHDPWQFRDYVNTIPGPTPAAQRPELMYLAYPDVFDPIVNDTHRRKIRDTFADAIGGSTDDVDRDLYEIRGALEAETGGPIEFYQTPYVERWRPKPASARSAPGTPSDLARIDDDEDGSSGVWWVNQGDSYAQARDAGIIWAPLTDKAGRSQAHWDALDEVQIGDAILHYKDGRIRAVSEVTKEAQRAQNPFNNDSWGGDGRIVETVYKELNEQIPVASIPKSSAAPFPSRLQALSSKGTCSLSLMSS